MKEDGGGESGGDAKSAVKRDLGGGWVGCDESHGSADGNSIMYQSAILVAAGVVEI